MIPPKPVEFQSVGERQGIGKGLASVEERPPSACAEKATGSPSPRPRTSAYDRLSGTAIISHLVRSHPCRGGSGPARKHDHRATNQTAPIIINASQTLTVRGSAHDRTNDHRVYEAMCTATTSGWIGATVKLIALIAPIKAKQWKTLRHAANDRIAVIQLNYSTSKQQNRHTAISKIQYQAVTANAAPMRRDENPARLTRQRDCLTS